MWGLSNPNVLHYVYSKASRFISLWIDWIHFLLNRKIKQQRLQLVVKAMLFNTNAAYTSRWHCYIKYIYCEHNVIYFFQSAKKPIRANMDPSEVYCGEILRKRSVRWSNPTCTLVFFSYRLERFIWMRFHSSVARTAMWKYRNLSTLNQFKFSLLIWGKNFNHFASDNF